MDRTSHLVMFILLMMLWTGVAGYFVVDLWQDAQRQKATAVWPSTEGVLLSKELQTIGDTTEVAARYSYQVDGQVFEGERVAFNASLSEQRQAVRGIDEGSAITVYYSAGDPSQSTLIQGLSDGSAATSWFFIAVLAGMTGLGWLAAAGGLVRALRRGLRK